MIAHVMEPSSARSSESSPTCSVSAVYYSPLGPIRVSASARGVCSVELMFGKHGVSGGEEAQEHDHQQQDPRVPEECPESTKHVRKCLKWLESYFSGDAEGMKAHMPQLDLVQGGKFYNKVWQALLSVEYGQTVTYGELAAMSGSPGAARAVGQAVHHHHLPLLVPCHRVVYSGGGVGNYSGGDWRTTKEWLLQHEAQIKR